MKIIHYDQRDLANRWRLSPRTLERWRWERIGPTFLKIGGRVVYRLSDIEDFEQSQVRASVEVPVQTAIVQF